MKDKTRKMPASITVNVTTEDIISARDKILGLGYSRTTSCPISEALKRAGRLYPLTSINSIRFGGMIFTLPREACDWVHHFDTNNEGKPFKFRARREYPIPR